RLPAADRARTARAEGAEALLPAARRRSGRCARGRDPRLPAARRGRAPAAVRGLSLRRPLAARKDTFRDGFRSDDARLRAGGSARLPGVADRPRTASLAGVPARDRLRLRPLALGPLGRGRRLVVALAARGLAPPRGGDALGRRPAPAGVRDLAARARAATALLPALLGACDPADRRAARGRDVPEHPAAPAPVRPVDCALRPGAARQARARLARAALGRGAPLPRPAEAGARGAALRGPAAQPDRRERRRHGDPAGRGRARRLEA